ncbi:MAG TPA: hypothetical protein VMF89_11165 [Polyangiales bacterium]|nr:hypothetical protein [Polyangiales bacterium]
MRDSLAADGGDEAEFEGCPDTTPSFSLGMSTSSPNGNVEAVLLAASRVPPARFLNDWTVSFVDAESKPLSDVMLRSVRAFMPVHGHYGLPDPKLAPHEAEAAVFDIDALNLFMRGPWQIKLEVSSPESGNAELIFEVCVEE